MGNNNSNSGGKKPSTPKPDEKHDPDGSITKKRKVIQINISILGNRGVGMLSLIRS